MNGKLQTAALVLCYLLGTALFGLAGYLAWQARPAVSAALHRAADLADRAGCRRLAEGLGLAVTARPDGTLRLSRRRLEDPVRDLGRASAVIAGCRGFRVVRFCAGLACGKDQLHLELRPHDGTPTAPRPAPPPAAKGAAG